MTADPTPARSDDGGEVEAALDGHAYTYPDSFCECGRYVDGYAAWKSHMAEVIAPLLARHVAKARAEALREAADAVERAEGPTCKQSETCHAADAVLLRLRARADSQDAR